MKFKSSLCRTLLSVILLFSCVGKLNRGVWAAGPPSTETCAQAKSGAQTKSRAHNCAPQICTLTPPNLRPVQDGRIPLGRLKPEPYVVAVPGRNRNHLQKVRLCIPDALILPSRRGQYIHVASFENRSQAEKLSHYLRKKGLDARVTYFQN